MANESARRGRYPVTVDIDRFETGIGRQLYAGLAQRPGDGLQTHLDPFNSGIRFQYFSVCGDKWTSTSFGN
jgi:hypothetical protein